MKSAGLYSDMRNNLVCNCACNLIVTQPNWTCQRLFNCIGCTLKCSPIHKIRSAITYELNISSMWTGHFVSMTGHFVPNGLDILSRLTGHFVSGTGHFVSLDWTFCPIILNIILNVMLKKSKCNTKI